MKTNIKSGAQAVSTKRQVVVAGKKGAVGRDDNLRRELARGLEAAQEEVDREIKDYPVPLSRTKIPMRN